MLDDLLRRLRSLAFAPEDQSPGVLNKEPNTSGDKEGEEGVPLLSLLLSLLAPALLRRNTILNLVTQAP